MADLYFKVRADWEEAMRLRKELELLEKEILDTSDATEEGRNKIAKLSSEYKKLYDELKNFVDIAAKNAHVLQDMGSPIPDMVLKMGTLQKASLSLGKSLIKMGLSAAEAKALLGAIATGGVTLALSAVALAVSKLVKVWKEKKEAIEEAKQAQEEFFEEIGKKAAPTIAKFEELRGKWADLKSEMAKVEFLRENKKALDQLGVSLNTVAEADQLFIDNADNYVRAQIRYAEADIYRASVQKQVAEAAALLAKVNAARESGETEGGWEYFDTGGTSGFGGQGRRWVETPVADRLQKEYDAMVDTIKEGQQKVIDTMKLGDNELLSNQQNGPFFTTTLQQDIDAAKKKWEDAKAALKDFDANKRTSQQYKEAVEAEAKARKEYEELAGKESKQTVRKTSDEIQKAYEKYGNEIQRAISQIWGDIATTEVKSIEDANKRELAAIEQSYRADLSKIAQMRAEVEALGLPFDKWVEMDNQLADLTNAATARYKARLSQNQRNIDDQDRKEAEALEELLAQYGTYEERKAQIHLKWLGKIGLADEEHARIYQKLYQQELDNLEKEYSAEYALVFQNAADLTDEHLAQALQIVQEKIAEAKDDAADLNALYERLMALQAESRARNSSWGFGGIGKGVELLATAQSNINSGDKNKQLLGYSERSEALQRIKNGVSDILDMAEDIASIIPEMTGDLSKGEKVLRGIGGFLTGIASSTNFIMKTVENILPQLDEATGKITLTIKDKGAATANAISAAAQMLSSLFASIHANKLAEEEWNKTIIRTADAYKSLELDKLAYKSKNIFGVEDPFKRATDSANLFNKSMEEIQSTVDRLNGGRVQTGTKKAIDWSKVAQNAAVGAAAGGMMGAGVFSWAGAAIGAGVGAIVGLFSTKVEPIFDSLANNYDYLFDDETYELNPQILADYAKLDDETKLIVDHWEEVREKAKAAREELKDNLKEYTGDIGKQLEDVLVEAWKSRRLYSAIDEFQKYVSASIAKIMQDKVFSAIFSDMFTELEQRMTDSFFGENGDQDITDDLDWLNTEYQKRLKYYDQAMSAAQEQMEKMGYEGFDTDNTKAEASRSSYQNISETTASAIEGRLTSIQISSEVRNQALELTNSSLAEMLRRQMETVTMADDIRTIQAQSYVALITIRDNTGDNLKAVKDIQEKIVSIEKHTRNL